MPPLELMMHRALANPDAARDAVQEVLERATRAIEQGATIHGPLGAFVHGIALHVIADHHRAAARSAEAASATDVDELASPAPDALDALIDAEDKAAVRRVLERLGPADRRFLRRCYVDGLTIAEIARESGEPAARLRKRKSRLEQRLREELGATKKRRHTSGEGPTT